MRGTLAALAVLVIGAFSPLGVARSFAENTIEAPEGLLAPMRGALERVKVEAAQAPEGGLSRARLLLVSGDIVGASEVLVDFPRGEIEVEALRAEIAFRLHEYEVAREAIKVLLELAPESEETRRCQVKWFLAADDLEGLETFCEGILSEDPDSPAALLGKARLHQGLMQQPEARAWFRKALPAAADDWERLRALEGIADTHYDEQHFDSSLVYLEKALPLSSADDRLLESLSLTLIRLGRVAEAIDAAELAIEINPYNDQALYLLGNGYSRLNYSELEAAYPDAFPDGVELSMFAAIDSTMRAGDRASAVAMLHDMARGHGNLTDLHVRLGSFYFEESDLDEALGHFQNTIAACPGNGRARNGLAKTLETKRLLIDAHRESYEKAFESAPWPKVPRIDEFVLNYSSLSDRHKKRVAMSIAPLGAFVPVLIESGASFYIKPLHERLSSCPGLEVLKDTRIDYDSRLWDDVRGCGGYSTVTGIEDVERTVLSRYNTVLHELAHQVHSVLTVEENRAIQELYRKAKENHGAKREVFVSRYQASSVWEYLAEGVNSYMTPQRDRYDTKQVVRERLETRDPELLAFVESLMAIRNMEPYYAVGYANAGNDRLSRNQVEEGIAFFRKSLERDPGSPEGQSGLIFALSIVGDHEGSCEAASKALADHPDKAQVVVSSARAFYLRDGDGHSRIGRLEQARDAVEERERYLIDLELGDAYFVAGRIDSSIKAFHRVLDYQGDNPEALWGTGFAISLTGDIESAKDYFDKALRRRSGLVDLRTDYATVLLRAGDFDGAAAQLGEAELLDPQNSSVAAIRGWLEIARREPAAAIPLLELALQRVAHNDIARTLLADARLESGDPEGAWRELEPSLQRLDSGKPPEYFYNDMKVAFEMVHTFPAYERKLLYEVAAKTAGALDRKEDAERFINLANDELRIVD